MFLFLVPPVASVNFVIAQGQTGDGQFPQSIIVSSSTDTTPHLLKLKGIQQGDTETRVSGFSLDTTSAIGAQANSQLLVLVTDSSLRVTEAKVRTASNQIMNLVPATSQQAGAFSLANLPGGVYTLDVITQKGNAKAAYEGVLSIGQQPLTVIEETTKRVTNDYGDLYIIFPPPENILCPDGSTVPPGEDCPPDPCTGPNPPLDCPQPPDPCDGPNPPLDCPQPPIIDGPCDVEPLPPECEEPQPPGFLPPENGEEPPPEENEGEEGEDESSEEDEESEESEESDEGAEDEDAGGADEEDAGNAN